MKKDRQKNLFIVSDGTGETAGSMTRAALIQFLSPQVKIVRYKNVRTTEKIEALIKEALFEKGLIIYTIAKNKIRDELIRKCKKHKIPFVDLLGPLLENLKRYLGTELKKDIQSGLLHNVDEKYFKRIEAIEYTVRHDDGNLPEGLKDSDLVLVGISRTSKTPLSIFLSHKGWKVANIPLVFNTPLPKELYAIDQKRIVGLIIDPDALYKIRTKRIQKFKKTPSNDYADLRYIQKEMDYALSIFSRNRKWPVFNVTDRALEETASEILSVISERLNLDSDNLL